MGWAVVGVIVAIAVIAALFIAALGGSGDPSSRPPTTSATTAPVEPAPTTGPPPTADAGGPTPPLELAPVPIDAAATPAPGSIVSISAIEAVDGEAEGPGEVAGPAIRFAVDIVNESDEDLDLSTLVVNVESGPDRAPAQDLSGPGRVDLPDRVAGGESVQGVYVFAIDPARRDAVRISVELAAGVPVAVFEGAAPR